MNRVILSIGLVLVVIYVVPFIVCGAASAVFRFETPAGVSPVKFLLSVLVSKTGTAVAFVLLYHFARNTFHERWLLYGCTWWLMFAIGEIGQALGPNYSWTYAIAGVISETIYFPVSALVTHRLLRE